MKRVSENTTGQITMFVIIGAILLLAAVLLFTLTKNLTEDKPRLDIPDVSLEARPAYELITQCLQTTSEEALRRIGEQGGTMQPPPVRYPPYRSEAIDFDPSVIPYWRHLDDCDGVPCERTFMPPLCKSGNTNCAGAATGDNSIQEQLEVYVEDEILSCINNFDDIANQYDISIEGEPDVEVQFADQEVIFLLDYPIVLTSLSTENTEQVNNYLASLNVDLLNMYDLAGEILQFEREFNYYETETMSLLSIYGEQGGVIPPMAGFSFFDRSFNIWILQDVKEILQYDLLPYMGLVRFMNTRNYFPIEDNYEDLGEYDLYARGVYEGMTPKTSNTIYPFNVYHRYLYQDIYLEINDGEQIIKPQNLMPDEVSPFFDLLGLNLVDYRFDYYLSYPLVVEIEDEDALFGEGYTFQFGIEVNIRNNIPGYEAFYDASPSAPFEMSLNDLEHHLPQIMTIKTTDKHTGEALEDVRISYVCGQEYDLGETKLDANGEAVLYTTLPYCEFGGFLRYQHLDYLGEAVNFNNRLNGTEKTFTFELWPVQTREIIIKKRTPADLEQIAAAGEDAFITSQELVSDLSVNQNVLFNIERIKESAYDTDVPLLGFVRYLAQPESIDARLVYEQEKIRIEEDFERGLYNETIRDQLLDAAEFNYNNPIVEEVPDVYTIDLVPGTYAVDMTLLDSNGISIPAKTLDLTQDVSLGDQLVMEFFASDAETEVELPAQNFTIWMLGGGVFNTTLSENQVYNNNPITFYVLEMPKPTDWDDLMNMVELSDYQKGKEFYLNPKI